MAGLTILGILLAYSLALGIPIVVFIFSILRLRARNQIFQYGIFELLSRPIAMLPAFLVLKWQWTLADDKHSLIFWMGVYAVLILLGGFLAWAMAITGKGSWSCRSGTYQAALWFIAGGWIGPALMFVPSAIIIFLMKTFHLDKLI